MYEPKIAGPPGRKIYGNSPYNFDGTPKLGPNGRPKIEFSDDGLSSTEQAVGTAITRAGTSGTSRSAACRASSRRRSSMRSRCTRLT